MSTFERSAGWAAIVAGIAGTGYSFAFVLLRSDLLAALFLLVGAIVSVQALAAVYRRVREVDAGFALTGFLFGFAGAIGAALHAGTDLSNVLHPPAVAIAGLPSAADPRGLATFGFAGISMLVLARLIQRGAVLPRGLALLGYVSGALLIVIYLGRLIVLDATSPLILAPAGIEGFIVNPLWYLWLGTTLLQGKRT